MNDDKIATHMRALFPKQETMTEPVRAFTSAAVGNWIASVEQAVGKSPMELREPDEVVKAFDAWPSSVKSFGPELLYWFWRQGRLSADTLRRVLLDMWRNADFPVGPGCPAKAWREMFKAAGFLSDTITKPTRQRVLYRGCTPEGRRGMSWTTERWVAEKFADYWFERGQAQKPGHVYKTVAGPRDVLAAIYGKEKVQLTLNGVTKEVRVKPEFEWIVDARSLPITLMETAKARLIRFNREEDRERRRSERIA
jgi:hypothetical protein